MACLRSCLRNHSELVAGDTQIMKALVVVESMTSRCSWRASQRHSCVHMPMHNPNKQVSNLPESTCTNLVFQYIFQAANLRDQPTVSHPHICLVYRPCLQAIPHEPWIIASLKKLSTVAPCRLTGALAIFAFAKGYRHEEEENGTATQWLPGPLHPGRIHWLSASSPWFLKASAAESTSTQAQHLDINRATHCIVNLLEVAEEVNQSWMRSLPLVYQSSNAHSPSGSTNKSSKRWNLVTNQQQSYNCSRTIFAI